MRRSCLCACLLAALTFCVSAPVTALASPSGPAATAKKKKKKKKKLRCNIQAVAKGKRACLKLRAPCVRTGRPFYLRKKLDCRRKRLVRASPAAIRGGRLIVLPSSGVPTFSQAKDLFDQVVADLPGVSPKKGSVGKTASGSSALMWLIGHVEQLTDAQRAVLLQVLTPSAETTTIQVDQDGNVDGQPPAGPAPAAAFSLRSGAPLARISATKEEYDAIVRDAIPRMAAKGVAVRHPVTISVQGASPPRGDAANASPQWLTGLGNSCFINTYDPANNAGINYKRQVILHELTHCA